jgi:hypothetical protein
MTKICNRCSEPIEEYKGTSKICLMCGVQYIGDPLRDKARKLVRKAYIHGKIPYPDTLVCVDCGRPAYCYDHRDYNKPFDVVPVCAGCNSKRGAGSPPIPNKYGSRVYPK